MATSKFKRALSVMLSSLMLLPTLALGAAPVSAGMNSTVIPLSDYASASQYLAIYKTADVAGVDHSFGENVGSYAFDANENALLLKKSTADYMGGYYRFHLKASTTLSAEQPWMVVTYKTNATQKASFTMASNGNTSDKVTLAEDITVSNGEWVCSTPVNIDTNVSNNLLDRLVGGNHDAMVVNLPQSTPDSVYFYIKTIAFFRNEADAKNYVEHGVLPTESIGAGDTARTGTSSFVGGSYTYEGTTIPTSLYVPKNYSADKEYALLIYFHNVGGRGSTPYWSSGQGNQLVKNVIDLTGDNVIVFAPRCPTQFRWAEQDWATGMYDYANTPISKPMSAVISYIYDEIMAKYSIDKTRVWAFGDSMGGGGTWDLVLREPDLLAAAVPVAGYCDPTEAVNVSEDTAIWAIHTAQDKTVNVRGDRAMTAALANLGRNVKYTEYDSSDPDDKALFNESWNSSTNWEHWAWVPAYNDKSVAEWLVAQQRKSAEPNVIDTKFTDISASDKAFKAICYATEVGLFQGTSDTTFSPDTTMTRSMFVTVLGRLAGVDVSSYTTPTFSDVAAGQWYTPYVEWAAATGVVNGYGNGIFGINDEISVQQACLILQRYADSAMAGRDTQLTTANYSDSGKIADYAVQAMQWALSNGIYMGSGTRLNPSDSASRALVATIFYNYNCIFGN